MVKLENIWCKRNVGIVFGVLLMSIFICLGKRASDLCRSMATAGAVQRFATPYSMAFVTVPNEEVAKSLAKKVVEKKLAACVNIIPRLTSIYEWEGKINEDSELLMMIKTRTSIVPDLTTFIRENHPYSVCEVIATSIEQGNQPYLDWIGSVVPEKSH